MSSLLICDNDGHKQENNPDNKSKHSSDYNRNVLQRNALNVIQVASTRDAADGPTDIQRFYSGASVLVTGATGFMGKVLIEKLLRSCPDIDSIYMMVREKKGRSLSKRIDDLVSSPCFDRIKCEQPDFRSKLHAVAGDMGLEGLGISDSDRHLLEQQITIVFHMAATVRFDEHLKLAILQNVRGTREVLNLCSTFTNIKSFVHVSTAYSNCPRKQINEQFYEAHLPSDEAIHLAETLDAATLDRFSHKLMGDWPNTYSFTKALSEDVVRKYGHDFPVTVVRPSIVVCTKSEPVAGWIDNVYGPSGVLVATSAGLLRTMQVNEATEANLVPCDMVINALIAAAWDVVENRSPDAEIPVYNFVSPKSNRLTWKRFTDLYLEVGTGAPPFNAIWFPNMKLFTNTALYHFYRLFVHILPALLVDLVLLVTNRSMQMVKIYGKIHKFTNVIAYFATQEWYFETKNVDGMWKRLHNKDKVLFSFDMDSLDWFRYIQGTYLGIRLHLLKDSAETIPAALKRWHRLKILHYAFKVVLIATAFWTSYLAWAALRSTLEHSAFYVTLTSNTTP